MIQEQKFYSENRLSLKMKSYTSFKRVNDTLFPISKEEVKEGVASHDFNTISYLIRRATVDETEDDGVVGIVSFVFGKFFKIVASSDGTDASIVLKFNGYLPSWVDKIIRLSWQRGSKTKVLCRKFPSLAESNANDLKFVGVCFPGVDDPREDDIIYSWRVRNGFLQKLNGSLNTTTSLCVDFSMRSG